MKIYITFNSDNKMGDYTHINFTSFNDNWHDVLHASVEDAEATDVVVDGVLSYLALEDASAFLHAVARKLRHKGCLTVHGVHAYEVAKDFAQYKLTIEQFNQLMYGVNGEQRSGITLAGLREFLRDELSLTIVRQSVDQYHYVVEAQRP